MAPAPPGGTEYDPAALERAERHARADLWDAAPPAVAAEYGIERRDFGPIEATTGRRELGRDVTLLLGAAEPGAADEGFLAEAVEWCRGRDARAYAPLVPGRLGFDRAQAWLERDDFERSGGWVRFARDPHPPRFPKPEGIEVRPVEPGDDTPFGFEASFGASSTFGVRVPSWLASVLAALPGRDGWRCYVALAEGGDAAAAAVFDDGPITVLAVDTAWEIGENRARPALLHRIIVDAAAAGAKAIAARVDERADGPPKSAATGLLLAGFEEAYRCPGWVDARLPAR
ncbi:MAG TPA: hypothetical protein VIJ21_08570 [Solirubrobacterales bacterium]